MTTEASLLDDIASLAALINKHKAAVTLHPVAPRHNTYTPHPPHTVKKFSNLSFKPSTQTPSNTSTTTPNTLTQQPPLVHTHQFQLVTTKPKPHTPSLSPQHTTHKASSSPSPSTPYVKLRNKLVRKSSINKSTLLSSSPHKKFILMSPTTARKSVSSSPSLKIKQQMMEAAVSQSQPSFYRRRLSLNPALASKRVSILATYFRHGNTLVRKKSNKYVRPGVIIPDKKPLVKPSSSSSSYRTPTKANGAKKVTIDGQVYVKTPRGRSMVRSSKKLLLSPPLSSNKGASYASSTTSSPAVSRVLASNRVKRSLKQAREKKAQYCLFYNKFGKCNRKESCRYIHDPDKVAVCRKFLKGKCEDPNCLLQHKIDSDKMPVCWHFLRGVCAKENCPYSHVYVNPQAEICPDFQNGYCPKGKDCKLKHIYKKREETDEEKEKRAEKRRLEEEEEQREVKRRKEEEEQMAKEIRPNFSALFHRQNNNDQSSVITDNDS